MKSVPFSLFLGAVIIAQLLVSIRKVLKAEETPKKYSSLIRYMCDIKILLCIYICVQKKDFPD